MMDSSLSRKILIGIMVLFVLSLFGLTALYAQYVWLTPADVFPGMQLWRLITYPLFPGFLGLIVGSICFSTPAEELEQMIGTRQFGALLVVVTIAAGLMHTILFFGDPKPPLYGMTNASVFVLLGYVYLFPHSETRIIFFLSVRSRILLAIVASVCVLATVMDVVGGETAWTFFGNGGLGLLLGALYFHVRYQKYPLFLRPIRTVERIVAKERPVAATKPASAPRRAAVPQPARIRNPFQKVAPREMSDEERLNQILDRINELSYGGLSEEEKRFLQEYSGKL